MSDTEQLKRRRRSIGAVLLEFLGSMNLAIILLVAIAIASVIGTVLKQNEAYNNYVIKFGPYWFEVFKELGLFDIYGAPWFLGLLAFLLLSTSVCIYRNAPQILKDMRHHRLDVQLKSLRAFHQRDEWQVPGEAGQLATDLGQRLQRNGYQVKQKVHEGHVVVSAMKGGIGRLGYVLTHAAIVVICIGALVDGNLPLKFAEWRGDIRAETRDLPVTQMPAKSVLPADNSSFRGSVTIPEGSRADFIFLGLRDGYLVQKLPFTVGLDDFRIEHYPSGMPKSFESDIVIMDKDLKEPLRKTISVNHPLVYKGYAIYQASFADGGSKVSLQGWSLDDPKREPLAIDAQVNSDVRLNTPRGEYSIEVTDFKMFNIFPVAEGDKSGKKFQNYGPSVIFKLRAANGEAREYVNYMAPVTVDGRPFFLSGMRTTPSEDYRFLHIPVDPKGGIERFMRFLALAQDEDRVRRVAEQQAASDLGVGKDDPMFTEFTNSITALVKVFVRDGIDAVVKAAEGNVPAEKRQEALSSYIKVIQGVLGNLYLELLHEEGVNLGSGVGENEATYFDDALNAISLIGPYGSPVYLKLQNFEHVEASGLQITKAPGQNIVYLGCVMLMVGVFFMFYLHHRRLWLWLETREGETTVLFAAATHRQRSDFEQEFERLGSELRRASGAILNRI